MRLNVGLSLLAVGVCWTSAHAQDLSAFRATFEGSLAEIEATCTQRSSALGAPYLRSVEALYEQSRGAGDLAGALAAGFLSGALAVVLAGALAVVVFLVLMFCFLLVVGCRPVD